MDEFEIGYEYYLKKEYEPALAHFRIAKEQGDSRAEYAAATYYHTGRVVGKDAEKAKELILDCIDRLESDAKRGVKRANFLLYLAYSTFDFLKNDKKFFEILSYIYETGYDLNEQILNDLASAFESGIGTARDLKKSRELFEESYEKFHSKAALFSLANMYVFSLGVEKDTEKALSLFKEGLDIDFSYFVDNLLDIYTGLFNEFGDPYVNYEDAKKLIDHIFEINPKSVTGGLYKTINEFNKHRNIAQAKRILKEIVFEKDEQISAMSSLLNKLSNIVLKPDSYRDYEQLLLAFFEKCLDINNVEALCPYYTIAWFYRIALYSKEKLHLPEYIEKEYIEKMLNHLKDGVENNDAYAMWFYAELLRDGETVERDYSKALKLFGKSVELMNDFSCSLIDLAECYEYGFGTDIDYKKAIEYYKKAYLLKDNYSNGSPKALINLIYLLEQIISTKESKEEAKALLNEADLLGKDNIITFEYKSYNDFKKIIWIDELYAKSGDDRRLGSIAEYYKTGTGVEKDINKAIELYSNDNSDYKNYSLCEIGKIFFEGVDAQRDIDKAYQYFKQSIEDTSIFTSYQSYEYLYRICIDRSSKYFNPKLGLEYLIKTTEENENNYERSNGCYLLASFYHSNEFGLEDRALAKKYYKLAYDLGVNCQYAIESLEKDEKTSVYYQEGLEEGKLKGFDRFALQKYAKEYAREKYALETPKGIYKTITDLLLKGVSGNERRFLIENELKDDFKEVWSSIKDEAKRSMITALFTYSSFIEMGIDCYSELDFSPVVNGLSKAFEVELKEFFFEGYLKYLKEHNISYKKFIDEGTLIQVPIIESKVYVDNGVPRINYQYASNGSDKNFSLGQVYFLITNGQGKKFYNRFVNAKDNGIKTRNTAMFSEKVNPHIVDYFDELFSENAFPSIERKRDIANYLMDFAEDVRTIKLRRNSGSHENVMTVDDAELCADYLIKVKKLMYSFLIKIKSEYRKRY